MAAKVVALNMEVIKRLLDDADFDRLDMSTWVRDAEGHSRLDSIFKAGRIVEECGTAGCIAGWVCAFYAPRETSLSIASTAASLLAARKTNDGVRTIDIINIRTFMFHVDNWPYRHEDPRKFLQRIYDGDLVLTDNGWEDR